MCLDLSRYNLSQSQIHAIEINLPTANTSLLKCILLELQNLSAKGDISALDAFDIAEEKAVVKIPAKKVNRRP